MTNHKYYNVRNVVITAISKATNVRQDTSFKVTGHEAHKYINQEYKLHKTCPSDKGLYGEFTNIRVEQRK